ncbi:hypothetical protein BsWGS_16446 [Bradybaena similaris]
MPVGRNVPAGRTKDTAKSRRAMTAKAKQVGGKDVSAVSSVVEKLKPEQELQLRRHAHNLMEPGKGILAADDSMATIDTCLRSMKLLCTDLNRTRYMDVLIGDRRELSQFVSGILVNEDLLRLRFHKGRSAALLLQEVGVQLGVRAVKRFVTIPGTYGEWATVGLDTASDDCRRFKDKGATFALWRCVYKVSHCTPSTLAMTVNSNAIARFASACQSAGLVSVVSAELLPDGDYDPNVAHEALKEVLTALMASLRMYGVFLEGVIIRLAPAFPGVKYTGRYKLSDVVRATLQACNSRIPAAVTGIMLCRRETLEDSVQVLDELNKCPMMKPYVISFCYSRVIHNDVIKIWAGQDGNLQKARNALLERAKVCSLASMGQCPEHNRSLFISNICNQ